MASSSRFVDLSEDDIIKFCDEQENENTAKKGDIRYRYFQGIPCVIIGL